MRSLPLSHFPKKHLNILFGIEKHTHTQPTIYKHTALSVSLRCSVNVSRSVAIFPWSLVSWTENTHAETNTARNAEKGSNNKVTFKHLWYVITDTVHLSLRSVYYDAEKFIVHGSSLAKMEQSFTSKRLISTQENEINKKTPPERIYNKNVKQS